MQPFRVQTLIAPLALAVGTLLASGARAENVSCKQLRQTTIGAEAIGLPTTGAVVTSATDHYAGEMAYCRVMGRIHPIDPTADDIRFEVNLPEQWNGKALHYGGGTFDGYLAAANGRGRTPVSLKSQATPLTRGYATFGSDGGHHRNYFPLPDAINAVNSKFGRNAEMERNWGGDALKKVHDVAVQLIERRYGRPPKRMYFIGGSTGGREALHVAQSFPADYDGVLAAYPAWDQVELDLQFLRTAQALYAPGGFLGPSKTRLIVRTVKKSCDAQDGLRDGIISDPAGCHVQAETLRCRDGRSHHGCLSDAQVHTLETFASEQRTSMMLSDGVNSIPGYNALSGVNLGQAVGLLPFPLHKPVLFLNSFGYVLGDGVMRHFLTTDRKDNALQFDVKTAGKWQDEVVNHAKVLDSTDANLRPFMERGGKLILVHGTVDAIVPTNSTVDYYKRLQATLGVATTASFAKLYLVPGLAHGFGSFNGGFDTIGTLDAWVERGVAPRDMVVTDNHDGRTRPLCEWPAWPRYSGSGDVNSASSFVCVSPTNEAAGVVMAAQ
jgi:feruloyl esterase